MNTVIEFIKRHPPLRNAVPLACGGYLMMVPHSLLVHGDPLLAVLNFISGIFFLWLWTKTDE